MSSHKRDAGHAGISRETTRYMSSHKRAGLKSCDYAATLDEIGRELGVSRERARQLEKRALAKAKQILERHGLTLQDLLDSQPEARQR